MAGFNHQSGSAIISNGASVYYEQLGDPAGVPILFLHGGFGTLEDFNPLVDALIKDHRLIAMDGRGQGKSTLGNGRLTYESMQDDAVALLDHLGIEKIILIGFSDGGMAANRIAIHHPARVAKLVAIAAPWKQSDLALIREPLEKVTPASWQQKFTASYDLYKSLNPDIDFDLLVKELQYMWLDESASGGYVGDQVAHIKAPTLVVRGDEDHVFSRESAMQFANEVKGSRLLTIPFAGHEVHKDQSAIVASMIGQFIAGK